MSANQAERVAQRYLLASSVMYHTTTVENAINILVEGLQPRKRGGYTTEYGDAALMSYYPRRPAFLGVRPWNTSGQWNTVLKVDVSGVPLAADIPSVAEEVGLSYGELVLRREGPEDTYKARPEAIRLLEPHAKRTEFKSGGYEEFVPMEKLAKAGSAAAKAAIKLTKTAAVYEDISPDRISLKRRNRKIEQEVSRRKWERDKPKELTMADLMVLGDKAVEVIRDLQADRLTEAEVWKMIEGVR